MTRITLSLRSVRGRRKDRVGVDDDVGLNDDEACEVA